MLHQTQAPRVAQVYDAFVAQFPTPAAMAAASPADVITAWDRLGYPRRARWLWDAARRIDADGWPEDLRELPGVGRYTAAAVAAQADGTDVIGIEVNIRRVCERVHGDAPVRSGSRARRGGDRTAVARTRSAARVDGSRRDGVRRRARRPASRARSFGRARPRARFPTRRVTARPPTPDRFDSGAAMCSRACARDRPAPSSSTVKRSRHSSTTVWPKSPAGTRTSRTS